MSETLGKDQAKQPNWSQEVRARFYASLPTRREGRDAYKTLQRLIKKLDAALEHGDTKSVKAAFDVLREKQHLFLVAYSHGREHLQENVLCDVNALMRTNRGPYNTIGSLIVNFGTRVASEILSATNPLETISPRDGRKLRVLKLAGNLITYGTEPQGNKAELFLQKSFPAVEKLLRKEFNWGRYLYTALPSLTVFLQHPSREALYDPAQKLFTEILNTEEPKKWEDRRFRSLYARMVATALIEIQSLEAVGLQAARRLFATHGLPPTTLETWKDGLGKEEDSLLRRQNLEGNIDAVRNLDEQEPGSVRELYKRFNILHFGRYPVPFLQQQYQSRNDKTKPYGISVYPHADHNGAFWKSYITSDGLSNKIQNTHQLRIVEAGSAIDLVRLLVSLDRIYGAQHKISFAVIGGHGSYDSIQFGKSGKRAHITSENLLGKAAKRAGKFFEDEASMILNSCSTGRKGGIGQHIAHTTDLRVLAPNSNTSLEIVNPSHGRGKNLHFQVEYREDQTHIFDPGKGSEASV